MQRSQGNPAWWNDGVGALFGGAVMLLVGGCGGTIEGEVTDYATGAPI